MWVPLFYHDKEFWEKFKKELLSWEGTPYRHLGKTKGRGADCTLFIGQSMLNVGLLLDLVYDYYPNRWYVQETQERVLEGYYKHFRKYMPEDLTIIKVDSKKDLINGDIMSFSTDKNVSNHSAVWLGENNLMIDCISNIGRGVRLATYGSWWARRRTTTFRFMKEIA
jgi:cell wall-associated NlpC family hydrolase